MQRRLVAILAADVVGYSRLMGDRVHGQMCTRPEDADHWVEGYRKAGLPV